MSSSLSSYSPLRSVAIHLLTPVQELTLAEKCRALAGLTETLQAFPVATGGTACLYLRPGGVRPTSATHQGQGTQIGGRKTCVSSFNLAKSAIRARGLDLLEF